ncbi:hypothetical protein [Microbacterium sp. LMI1-1-1.1]|uniref:hypothetical protein n=1 Tax=Microbacterium sp. LMI1-1-1.1 TaxID=3135223 RepID=UPI00346625C1
MSIPDPATTGRQVNPYSPESFGVVSPVNEPETLRRCLAASPDIADGTVRLRTVLDARSAPTVIADALTDMDVPFVVYAHQDVYLPTGFFDILARQLAELEETDPAWAVVGAIGRDAALEDKGEVWSTDRGMVVGRPIAGPAPIECLDECLLVLSRRALPFVDTALPHFHLYGVDIVQNAKRAGATSYALPMRIVHHAKPITSLGGGYALAHRYMRRKWRARLPLTTLIAPLERVPWKLWKMRLGARVRSNVPARHPYGQATDPVAIARELGYE